MLNMSCHIFKFVFLLTRFSHDNTHALRLRKGRLDTDTFSDSLFLQAAKL